MKKINILIILIILFSFGMAVYFYPQMPERIVSHWNSQGEANGNNSKFWGLFLMPLISLIMFLLFLLIPKIDPLKANVEKFRKYFDWFILVLIIFFFYIYVLTIFWNLGYEFNFIGFLIPAFGLLFYFSGILIENAKRNWFIGIRTPWTLSSEKVWDKTHQLGGKLFKVSGIIAFLGILFPELAIYFVLIPIICVSFYLIVYSYLEYRNESR